MKKFLLPAIVSCLLLPGFAHAGESGAKFDISISQGGKVVSSPTIMGKFDAWTAIEIPGMVRIEAMAKKPNDKGLSETTVKFSMVVKDKMTMVKEMSAATSLSNAKPFEYAAKDSDMRFVVKPSVAELAEAKPVAQK